MRQEIDVRIVGKPQRQHRTAVLRARPVEGHEYGNAGTLKDLPDSMSLDDRIHTR
jgi:hypothetical protein